MGSLWGCEPTFPARTLTQRLPQCIKEEVDINVTSLVIGKTLWVYLPSEKLIDKAGMSWNPEGVEEMSKAIAVIHRVILSTDAKLDFIAVVAADVKIFGLELTAIEYIPDVKEAMLERFSRGEYFMRSVRDISFNADVIDDYTGESQKFHDITFNEFLSLQIIHRAKHLFNKDKTLKKVFELKSASWSEKDKTITIHLEFLKKTYELTPEEKRIDPLDFVLMLAAQIVKNYRYKDFKSITLKDAFSKTSKVLLEKDVKTAKIQLPCRLVD